MMGSNDGRVLKLTRVGKFAIEDKDADLYPVTSQPQIISLAPKTGQDKAGRSDFPHFAIRTAPGEPRKMRIVSPLPQKIGV